MTVRAAAAVARLSALLSEETARLAGGDTGGSLPFLAEKQELAAAIRSFALDGTLRSIPDAAGVIGRLEDQIDANKTALEHTLRVQRAVLGIITAAARKATPVRCYGRSGLAVSAPFDRLFGQRHV